MDYNQILELLDKFSNSNIDEFELEDGDFELTLKKNKNVVTVSPAQTFEIPQFAPSASTQTVEQGTVEQVKSGNFIKAPIVGTFYAATSPDKPPIVKVGDKVKKGDLLCIVEAMKIMNEITSDFDGEIAEILATNEDMVEYGQKLFRII